MYRIHLLGVHSDTSESLCFRVNIIHSLLNFILFFIDYNIYDDIFQLCNIECVYIVSRIKHRPNDDYMFDAINRENWRFLFQRRRLPPGGQQRMLREPLFLY